MNSNYVLKKDGYHKKDTSTQKGSADYFAKPIPPVRDQGLPLKPNGGGKVDWKQVERERREDA